MIRHSRRFLLLAGCAPACGILLGAAVPEPKAYRLDDYRAPVPDTVRGASVLHAAALHDLVRREMAILIDVLPAPRRPANMRPGTPWMPVVHRDIPGSLWWPEVGRGELPPELEQRFRHRLLELVAARPGRIVVFYCLRDCWMSWNATRRAASYGIRAAWFPDGIEGWADAGHALQEQKPDLVE